MRGVRLWQKGNEGRGMAAFCVAVRMREQRVFSAGLLHPYFNIFFMILTFLTT